MESSPIIWLCRPFLLRYHVTNSPKVPYRISTRTFLWTSQKILSISQYQNSFIWSSLPLTHFINAPVSGPPLPELEGLRMSPIGARRILFLEKPQQMETLWEQSETITIKLVLKIGGKIRNLSTKRMQGVYYLWDRIMLVQKRHAPKHQQRTRQNSNKSANIVRTKGSRVRPKFVRLFIERIWFVLRQKI